LLMPTCLRMMNETFHVWQGIATYNVVWESAWGNLSENLEVAGKMVREGCTEEQASYICKISTLRLALTMKRLCLLCSWSTSYGSHLRQLITLTIMMTKLRRNAGWGVTNN
jgi:hypothetical protein